MPSPFYNTGARYGVRALLGSTNIADIDVGMQAMRDDIENKLTGYKSGTHAARLAATALDGLLWRETDAPFLLYLGNGTAWMPVMLPGVWAALTPATGVSTPNSGLDYAAAARLIGDRVELRGTLHNGSGGSLSAIATVPAAAIPAKLVNMGVASAGGNIVQVFGSNGGGWSAGTLVVTSMGNNTFLSLDNFGYSLL